VVNKRRSGHALLVALIVLVLVASAGALVATHFGVRARLLAQEARRIHLAAMADAVISESLAHLAQSSTFAGVSNQEFGGGTISSEISSLPDNRREILASASYRGWTRQVRVQVWLKTGGLEVESWSPLPLANR